MITKNPKTKSGIRELSLNSTACRLLYEYQEWQSSQREVIDDDWIDIDRLFTQWNGAPIDPDTITDWFAKFIKKNHFQYVIIHSLRHTNATLMIAEGTDICTVSEAVSNIV